MAQKRKVLSRKQSKKNFSRGNRVKGKNATTSPMRGGIRL